MFLQSSGTLTKLGCRRLEAVHYCFFIVFVLRHHSFIIFLFFGVSEAQTTISMYSSPKCGGFLLSTLQTWNLERLIDHMTKLQTTYQVIRYTLHTVQSLTVEQFAIQKSEISNKEVAGCGCGTRKKS